MNKTFSVFYLSQINKFLFCSGPESAYLYYRDFRLNLLTGVKESYSISRFLSQLERIKLSYHTNRPTILHLFYEFRVTDSEQFHLEKLPANKPLALAIVYKDFVLEDELSSFIDTEGAQSKGTGPKISVEMQEYPNYRSYQKKFNTVYQHLLDGDCYQVNLTSQFCFKFSQDLRPEDFINQIWSEKENIGAYAHCTYIHSMDKLFLSNSPECLFQVKHKPNDCEIYTMPIKGTKKIQNIREMSRLWENLCESQKEQAELFMIADLLRNDLASIESTPASIIRKKLPLIVPGIIHQYSLIKTKVSYEVSLLQVLKSLFPGGSITGAPKKRVMEIISEVESNDRGFYCGSTVLLHKTLKAASINIRSAEIDFSTKEFLYGSGGGITLLSEKRSEFDETYIKTQSFLSPLGITQF